jgi:hypothetical protein
MLGLTIKTEATMMTNNEILAQKARLFSEDDCLDKLIEELSEALNAALDLRYSIEGEGEVSSRKKLTMNLIEELADVSVAGIETLEYIYPEAEGLYNNKRARSIQVNIRRAIEEKHSHQLSLFATEGDD